MNSISNTGENGGQEGRSKRRFGMNLGSSSILLIFVILCLVSFAALSIVSANADHRLSRRILERTSAYYDACSQAEEALAAVDRTLYNIYNSSSSEEEYFSTAGRAKSYTIPISDLQTLEVSIDILYPSKEGDTFYTINCWRVLTTGELDYSSTLPVPK